jgi:hypothetical protein
MTKRLNKPDDLGDSQRRHEKGVKPLQKPKRSERLGDAPESQPLQKEPDQGEPLKKAISVSINGLDVGHITKFVVGEPDPQCVFDLNLGATVHRYSPQARQCFCGKMATQTVKLADNPPFGGGFRHKIQL